MAFHVGTAFSIPGIQRNSRKASAMAAGLLEDSRKGHDEEPKLEKEDR